VSRLLPAAALGAVALAVVLAVAPQRAPALPAAAPASAVVRPAPATAEDPVGWLQGYLRIDTTNPPGNEAPAAAYLARILHRHGVPTRTLVNAAGRASLYARIEGRRDGEGLMLLHHIDVVAPGEGWRRQPFSGDLVAGELWGRGAIDVKSLGIAHLAAFLAVAGAAEPPERDVAFLAVADEESGGTAGLGWLLARHPELFAGLGAVYGEGGANRVVGGEVRWWGVEVAQKRPLWLEVRARGRGGHASGINLHSATHRLVAALARLLEMPRRWQVSEPVRRYLAALAPLHAGRQQADFLDPDAWVGPDGPRGPMLPGQPNLFLDTVQVTELVAGERINVVPDVATARIDVRLLPETDADTFLERVRRALGDDVEVEVLLASPPSPPSPVDHPAYRAAHAVLGESATVVPAFIAGFTDSRWVRERGLAAYGVSPFALAGDVLSGIHGPDERIPTAELERGIERMTAIVSGYAGRTD
jgi:acetylornithine deacetylase/succinyl-diaminopimelate desuccinylase-like protein